MCHIDIDMAVIVNIAISSLMSISIIPGYISSRECQRHRSMGQNQKNQKKQMT
jgi:hypothetical protein